MSDVINNNQMLVRSTQPIKLKDQGGRHRVVFHLEKNFGFVPEIIIIEKALGKNNTIVVNAVIPQSEIDKKDSNEADNLNPSRKG